VIGISRPVTQSVFGVAAQYKFGPNLSLPHYSAGMDNRSLLMVKEEAGARSLSIISHWLQRSGR
jgi:hypothetical protein